MKPLLLQCLIFWFCINGRILPKFSTYDYAYNVFSANTNK